VETYARFSLGSMWNVVGIGAESFVVIPICISCWSYNIKDIVVGIKLRGMKSAKVIQIVESQFALQAKSIHK